MPLGGAGYALGVDTAGPLIHVRAAGPSSTVKTLASPGMSGPNRCTAWRTQSVSVTTAIRSNEPKWPRPTSVSASIALVS